MVIQIPNINLKNQREIVIVAQQMNVYSQYECERNIIVGASRIAFVMSVREKTRVYIILFVIIFSMALLFF